MHNTHRIALIFLLALVATATHSANVYRCTSPTGSIELRDTPCNTSDAQAQQQVGAATLQQKVSDYLARTQSAADACKSKYTHECVDLEKRRASVQKTITTLNKLSEATTESGLTASAAITNARLNYRIADEDYERLDASLKTDYGRDNFNQLLKERSAAAKRRMDADSQHFRLTGKWLSR